MDIFEKARELGNMILETEEGKRLNDKRYIFDGNEEAKKMLYEYSRYREEVYAKIQSDNISEEELKEEQKKLKEKINEVMAEPVIRDMLEAEEKFFSLAEQVMSVLRATVEQQSVQESGGCTGSCASCSGCH